MTEKSEDRAAPTAAQAVRYAMDRLVDMAPPGLIRRELEELRVDRRRLEGYLQTAQELIERAMDEDDIHAIKEAAMASLAMRNQTARKRLAMLQDELKASHVQDDEFLDDEERHARARLRLAIGRQEAQLLNILHRGQRDMLVALVPKETRHDTAEPTDEQIDATLFVALDANVQMGMDGTTVEVGVEEDEA